MPDRKPFAANNWYWAVAGSTQTQVYSSASGDCVPLTDATFVAWGSDGTTPNDVASETLGDQQPDADDDDNLPEHKLRV